MSLPWISQDFGMIEHITVHVSGGGIWTVDHRLPKSTCCFSFRRESEYEHPGSVSTCVLFHRFERRKIHLQFLYTVFWNGAPRHLGHAHVDGGVAMVGDVAAGNDLPELVVDVKGALGCEFLGLYGLLESLIWLRLDALLGGLVEGVGYGQWIMLFCIFFISWFSFSFCSVLLRFSVYLRLEFSIFCQE